MTGSSLSRSDEALQLARMVIRDAEQADVVGHRKYEPETIVEIARALIAVSETKDSVEIALLRRAFDELPTASSIRVMIGDHLLKVDGK